VWVRAAPSQVGALVVSAAHSNLLGHSK
jgi:hypothetical protein